PHATQDAATPGRDGETPATGPGGKPDVVALLDERLRFETLLSRLSATFIHLPPEDVDAQIERALQQIAAFLGVERSSLFQFSEDSRQLWVTHTYTVPGVPPFPPIDIAPVFPWYTDKIRRGEVVLYTQLPDELPPEAGSERAYCLREGLQSHLAIPFKVGSAILGGIGIAAFRKPRVWDDALVQSLQLLGEVFANALARKRAEEQSRGLREQLAHAGRVLMMGELAASIAHEVNQPLSAIVGNAQAL